MVTKLNDTSGGDRANSTRNKWIYEGAKWNINRHAPLSRIFERLRINRIDTVCSSVIGSEKRL